MPIAFISIPQPWPASLILHSQAITLTTAGLLTTPIAGSGLAGFSKCDSKAQNRHGRQELYDSYLAGEARTV